MAHEAALAAAEQDKFWEMHDLLFANRGAFSRDKIIGYAKQLELDRDRFVTDLDTRLAASPTLDDVRRVDARARAFSRSLVAELQSSG